MQATFIKQLDGFAGVARLFKVFPPMQTTVYDDEETTESFNYVVVSAANVPLSGPETYIFGADETGKILNWSELSGSTRGTLNHISVLERAGYSVN